MDKQIFMTKQDRLVFSDTGRALLCLNEKKVTVTQPKSGVDPSSGETEEATMYEYDTMWLGSEKKRVENDADALSAAKDYMLSLIEAYDSSCNINSFALGGNVMWFDKEYRSTLMRRFQAEASAGLSDTKIWDGTTAIDISIANAESLINQLEVYAGKCYDTTAGHEADVKGLTTIEEVLSYNYKTGYPDKINLNTNK